MNEDNDIRIILKKDIADDIILPAISAAMGFVIDSPDHHPPDAIASAITISWSEGFRKSLFVMLPPTMPPVSNLEDVCQNHQSIRYRGSS